MNRVLILVMCIILLAGTASAAMIGVYPVDPYSGLPITQPSNNPLLFNLNDAIDSNTHMYEVIMQQQMMQQMYYQQQMQQRQQNAALQKFLTEQGYNPGPIDGVWGPRSEQAYEAYMSGQSNLRQ